MISNPVLPGFSPDPSLVRHGDWYYLANSSFEWCPGIPVHRSRDLESWEHVGDALSGASWTDLVGVPDSLGVWAPSISVVEDEFWVTFSIVWTSASGYKDLVNLLVTAPDVAGPWSAPVELNRSGFDPSFFHDEDGRHWLLNMRWDAAPGARRFSGIVAQEYDTGRRELVGEPSTIYRSETLVEGPNLYRHPDGGYLLLLAEGGTGWNHGCLAARSDRLTGPYRDDPQGSLLTSRHDPSLPLQKAGHGELVQTPAGEWYLVHLASRPVRTHHGDFCVLGRETCLQAVDWVDGWPRLAQGGTAAATEVPAPRAGRATPSSPEPRPRPAPGCWAADSEGMPGWPWRTLRSRLPPGTARVEGDRLTVSGGASPMSWRDHRLVARPVTALRQSWQVSVDAAPRSGSHLAGLMVWYEASSWYHLRVTGGESGVTLAVVGVDGGPVRQLCAELDPGPPPWRLRARLDGDRLGFDLAAAQGWRVVADDLDATCLSDDARGLRFTGAMVGVAVHDLDGSGFEASFEDFQAC